MIGIKKIILFQLPEDSLELSIYPFATRSFGDLIGQTIGGGKQKLEMIYFDTIQNC